jgi:hypothetical protein
LQVLLRVDFAEQYFPQIVVNGWIVVDDEDPVIGFEQAARSHGHSSWS